MAAAIIFSHNRPRIVSKTYIRSGKSGTGTVARSSPGTVKYDPDLIAAEPIGITAMKKFHKNNYQRESTTNPDPGHFVPTQPRLAPDKAPGATTPLSSGRAQFYPGVSR